MCLATKRYTHKSRPGRLQQKDTLQEAANSAFHLLNKRTLNKRFQEGDIVHIPDRILAKNPHSLKEALGKVKEILPSQRDYSIITLDGKILIRHFSDIVSASATKSNSDVTLIDPFQLIDWKDRTPPDHLYPKFKLFLENFKKGLQSSTPEITHQEADKSMQLSNSEEDMQTGDQRFHQAAGNPSPTGLVALIQKIMDPQIHSQ